MIALFTPSAGDLSIQYLYTIFGSVNNVITCATCTGGPSTTLLGSIFQILNTAILTIAIIAAVYFTIVGVVNTAHEGEFMGKNYANIWIPIRMVIGIALMIPTASGYSFIQIVMMWVILQGVGAADNVWSTGLSTIKVLGSPFASAPTQTGADTNIKNLFKGLVCDESARITQPDPGGIPTGTSFCAGQSANGFCGSSTAFNPNGHTYSLGPGGKCGVLNYCNKGSDANDSTAMCNMSAPGADIGCPTCQAQINALQTIIPTLRNIAHDFAQADWEYRDFIAHSANQASGSNYDWISQYCSSKGLSSDKCCVPGENDTVCKNTSFTFPPADDQSQPQNASSALINDMIWPNKLNRFGNFLPLALTEYQTQVSAAAQQAIQAKIAQTNQASQNDDKIKTGWIKAGAYYMEIAKSNNANFRGALPTLSFSPPSPLLTDRNSILYNTRNNGSAAEQLLLASVGGAANAGMLSGAPAGAETASTVSSLMGSANVDCGSTNTNPIACLIAQGEAMFIAVEIAYPIFLALNVVAGAVGYIDPMVVGTGLTQNPVVGVLNALHNTFTPLFFALMAIIIGYGAIMAVYIPLIPFVIFTTSAVGWMISVLEAMVAGPIVALGIMSPKGQHEFLGRSEQGLMMLFNVFLKPTLMIIGLFAGILIVSVTVGMINSFWSSFTGSLAGSLSPNNPNAVTVNPSYDPIGFFLFLGAKLMLIMAIVNKSFSAIYVLPNQILTWIGGPAGHDRGEEAMGEVKGGVEKMGGLAERGIHGGAGIAGKWGEAADKGRKDKEAKAKGTGVTGGSATT